jgi:hypothetical protein
LPFLDCDESPTDQQARCEAKLLRSAIRLRTGSGAAGQAHCHLAEHAVVPRLADGNRQAARGPA